MQLFKSAAAAGIKHIIFSSSASVYGNVEGFKATETSPVNPGSPYAMTKLMMENVIADYAKAYGLRAVSLRYFNPIGTDTSHRTGPFVDNPSHILGKLLAVSSGEEPEFRICGTQYPTRDGTGLRDYIHVWDIAKAHLDAISYAKSLPEGGHDIINLGTGDGTTVKEFISAFKEASQTDFPVKTQSPGLAMSLEFMQAAKRPKKFLAGVQNTLFHKP